MKCLCPLGVPQPGYVYTVLKLVLRVQRCILASFGLPHFVIGSVQHRAQHKFIFFSSLVGFCSHSNLHSVRSILHSVASAANFKHGHISVLQSSQWDGCILSMARIPSCCHSSCSNLSTRTEPSTNRRQPELCCGSLGTTSPAVPTSHLMCCSWIPVVSCFVSLPLLSASFLCLMW